MRIKVVPKGVLLEVRVEVEKVEKVKSTEFKTMWTETRYSIEQEQKSTVQTVLAQVHTHTHSLQPKEILGLSE